MHEGRDVETYRDRSGEALLELCRGGDPGAWEEIVVRHESLVYSVPLRLFELPREEAEEVFQETFLALLRHLDGIRNAGSLSAWLIGTAARISKDRLKRARRRARLLESLEAVGGEKEVHRRAGREEAELVERALATLDPTCRELLRLRYLVQPPASYEEISVRLGLAVGSVGPWK